VFFSYNGVSPVSLAFPSAGLDLLWYQILDFELEIWRFLSSFTCSQNEGNPDALSPLPASAFLGFREPIAPFFSVRASWGPIVPALVFEIFRTIRNCSAPSSCLRSAGFGPGALLLTFAVSGRSLFDRIFLKDP